MANWVDICDATELTPGDRKCPKGTRIACVNVDGDLYAFENNCPHAGLPLAQGDLRGKAITCPFHGYTYNVESGENIDFPADVKLVTYPVRIEEGKIQVNTEPDVAE